MREGFDDRASSGGSLACRDPGPRRAGCCSASAGAARAQHTPDPYNIVGEYNSQYEPYMYAELPDRPRHRSPNQGRLDGRSGVRNANSFQNFLDSDGDEPGDFGRSAAAPAVGPGTPYYRAYRRFDQEFQRTYRPNEAADRSYYNDQEKRNDKYFQALREPDPRKRSQLLRDYNLDNMRAARDLSSGRNAAETDREPARDRFSPAGPSLYPDEPDEREPSTAARPRPRRCTPAPTPATGPRRRPRRPATRPSTAPAPPPAGRSGARGPPGRPPAAPAPSRARPAPRRARRTS